MAVEIVMPQLGESVHEGTVGKWLKKIGEPVEKYEPLLEVITDKVDSEITATDSGVLVEIRVPEGETVKVGTVLALLGQPGEQIGAEETREQGVAQPAAAVAGMPPARERISPVVARIAAEQQVDLSQVPGTGAGGRITKQDIVAYVERRETAVPAAGRRPPAARQESAVEAPATPAAGGQPPASGPGDQEIPLSAIRKAIAEHMVRSVQTAPHVTTVMEVDMSRVEAIRTEHGAEFQRREGFSLTYMPFIVHAVTRALRAHPEVNAVWSGDRIILKGRIHIGVAVAVEDGLLVPVIRDADEKTPVKLARDIRDLVVRARDKRLLPDEAQGSTFTVTNHGTSGSILGTPIINQPNVAILGVGAVQKRVVVTPDDAIAIRPMCYVGLTFDHRVLDGAAADRFLMDVKRTLEGFSGFI